MIQIKQIVMQLLEDRASLRDDDNLLMSTIWKEQSNNANFFDLLEQGELYSPESIRRARQKIQEECPYLRGIIYDIRQRHQSKIRKQLGYKI